MNKANLILPILIFFAICAVAKSSPLTCPSAPVHLKSCPQSNEENNQAFMGQQILDGYTFRSAYIHVDGNGQGVAHCEYMDTTTQRRYLHAVRSTSNKLSGVGEQWKKVEDGVLGCFQKGCSANCAMQLNQTDKHAKHGVKTIPHKKKKLV